MRTIENEPQVFTRHALDVYFMNTCVLGEHQVWTRCWSCENVNDECFLGESHALNVYIYIFVLYFINDNNDKINVCDINHIRGSSPHISYFINCLWGEFITTTLRMGNNLLPWCRHMYVAHLTKYRSMNRHWNIFGGQCVSSWWPLILFRYNANCAFIWFVCIYFIYMMWDVIPI